MALFFYKEKNKDIRAAAYLRLSIEDGDKAESNSIGNQRELIRDFAAERPGLHLVEEYADDGYTGTNFERPGFKRMMEDATVARSGSTSNADRWICDFYGPSGGRQRSCTSGTGGSNASAGMVHIRCPPRIACLWNCTKKQRPSG